MPVATQEQILGMLVQAENDSGELAPPGHLYLYRDNDLLGLLVWKRTGDPPTTVELGTTHGHSRRESEMIKAITTVTPQSSVIAYQGNDKRQHFGVSRYTVNECESVGNVNEEGGYNYFYRPNSWHRPVLPGRFTGYVGSHLDFLSTGLYFNALWKPPSVSLVLERSRIEQLPKIDTARNGYWDHFPRRIWGAVPLEEILGMSRDFGLLANKAFVFRERQFFYSFRLLLQLRHNFYFEIFLIISSISCKQNFSMVLGMGAY